jgi:hypothetical protein
MLQGFLDAVLEHDDIMEKSELQGLQGALLQVLREGAKGGIQMQQPVALRHVEQVQRLEQSITQLKQDAEKAHELAEVKQRALQDVQLAVTALEQVLSWTTNLCISGAGSYVQSEPA